MATTLSGCRLFHNLHNLWTCELLIKGKKTFFSVTARKSFPIIYDKIIFVVIDSKTKFIAGCA